MSEFLFISTGAANGQRSRVRIGDIPGLFSEGLEETPAPAAFPWQSLWQRFAGAFAGAAGSINLPLKARLAPESLS
jgi:hypothetical protein